jgi:hypothetical protein
MRIIVMLLALVLGAGVASAQTGATKSGPTMPTPGATVPAKPEPTGPALRTGKSAVEDSKAECIRMWDAGTHMSKQEWSSTCARVQTRIENLKVENLDVMGVGVRKKSSGAGKQGSAESPSRAN